MNSLTSSIFGSPISNPINHKDHYSLSNFTVAMAHSPKRRCDFYDLHQEIVPYSKAWSWQNEIVNNRKILIETNEDLADSLFILQHQPVYTLGTGSSEEFLHFDVKNSPIDIYRTERGGDVTYHGPGQLVMYPIINLRYHEMDLHQYLRALEEVVIRVLSSTFYIEASRVEGLTGVWVGDQKLAAIGIKVSKRITYHGLALNVTTDITPFKQIVPCGIRGRQIGSIKGFLRESFSSKWCEKEGSQCFEDNELIDITYKSMVREFCEVFQVELQNTSIRDLKNREAVTLPPLNQKHC